MDKPIGYAWLYQNHGAALPPPRMPASVSSSANRRIDTAERILFPRGVALEETLPGHVEFALRHEDLNLPLLEVAVGLISGNEVVERLRKSPNGESLRRLAYWWEWFQGSGLEPHVPGNTGYIPLLDPKRHVVVENPGRSSRYRILENQLGNKAFCPTVRRTSAILDGHALVCELVKELQAALNGGEGYGDLYQRALGYIYLSETRSSFQIENEKPTHGKEQAFVSLLRRVSDRKSLSEDWLVELQNLAVRNDFSREFSFRSKQNWLDRDGHNVDFFPPAPEHLRGIMDGLMEFANDQGRKLDPIAKAAIVSFGFVYAHPFLDGNGRLHRFLLHHALAQSGLIPEGLVMPISAVLSKQLDRYRSVLTAFSGPVTELWEYRRLDDRPEVIRHPGRSPYAYWDATAEVELSTWALTQAVRIEVPREVRFLKVFDQATNTVNREFDLPKSDVNILVRCAIDQGCLSINRRGKYKHLPESVFDRIEAIVSEEQARLDPPVGA